jgi:hypothetical protein
VINFFAKFLVLIHTILSVAAMTWALAVFLQFKDFGWTEPYKEIMEYNKEGAEKTSIRHASIYDKSQAALTEAAKTRDVAYSYVKPALVSLRATEPYLADNHLYYTAELKKLRDATDPIEVKRLQNAGQLKLDGDNTLGKPLTDAAALKGITKSIQAYNADLKKVVGDIDVVELDIRKKVEEIKAFTGQLTGTDEANKYFQPGLYQLIDLEYKAQQEIKKEMADVTKPKEKAMEDARLYRIRRIDLQETLDSLKAIAPAAPKLQKKL